MASDGTYVTLDQVREEAGFTGNTNITDALIEEYIQEAEDELESGIATKYQLALSEIPKITRAIAKQLAAGFLLLKEYGSDEEGTSLDGKPKVEWARGKIDEIKTHQLILLDSNKEELALVDSVALSGFPDEGVDTDRSGDDDPPVFEVGEEF